MSPSVPGVRTVTVSSREGDYPVLVGPGALASVAQATAAHAPEVRRWAVVADDTVAPLYGHRVREALEAGGWPASLHSFPAGEAHKTRHQWARLTDALLTDGVGRDGGVVAVGGGVTGDLAGFVAATFMRGIPVIQVPTSVVAMVDSSVGGKTGVDTPAGKNLVGAFHPPRFVLADPDVLATLTPGQRAQGWAEALKHGAIVDRAYFARLVHQARALLEGDAQASAEAVLRSVEIKAGVVGGDEREGGLREILNFGHTLGHALEAASDFRLPHGSAVSLGMVLEARLGEALGITAPDTGAQLAEALAEFGLPASLDAVPDVARVEELLTRDKKVRDGRVRVVLLSAIGQVAGSPPCAQEVARESLRRLLEDERKALSAQA